MGSIFDRGEQFKAISAQNFRLFNLETEINLGKLTLMIGENNSGKSSIIQMLYIMKEFSQKAIPDVEKVVGHALSQRPLIVLLKILETLFETKGVSGKSGSFEQFLSKDPEKYEFVNIPIALPDEDVFSFKKQYKRTIKINHCLRPIFTTSDISIVFYVYCNENSVGEGRICAMHIYSKEEDSKILPIWSVVSSADPGNWPMRHQKVNYAYLKDIFENSIERINFLYNEIKSAAVLIKSDNKKDHLVSTVISKARSEFDLQLDESLIVEIADGNLQRKSNRDYYILTALEVIRKQEIHDSSTFCQDKIISSFIKENNLRFKSKLDIVIDTKEGVKRIDKIIAIVLNALQSWMPTFFGESEMIIGSYSQGLVPELDSPDFMLSHYHLFKMLDGAFNPDNNSKLIKDKLKSVTHPLEYCINFALKLFKKEFDQLVSHKLLTLKDLQLLADFSGLWLFLKYNASDNEYTPWNLLRTAKTNLFYLFCGFQVENMLSFIKSYDSIHFVTLSRAAVNRSELLSDGNYISKFAKLVKASDIANYAIDARENMSVWIKKFGLADDFEIQLDADSNSYKFFLKKKVSPDENVRILLADSGSGVIQLVVLVSAVTTLAKPSGRMKDDKNEFLPTTIILEEPEVNLHPKLQSILADFLHEMADYYNIRFIVETHSEYIIRRLQYLTAKGNISDPENINIINTRNYHAEVPGIYSNGQLIKINNDGSLSKEFFPGFFDEADNLAIDLYTLSKNKNN